MSATSTTVVGERWRQVVGYEGLFEVSNKGRVRGVDRVVWNKGGRAPRPTRIRGVIKAPWEHGPYRLVRLSREGKKHTIPVHRLVAEAFLGPPPTPKHEVLHRDGNSHNDVARNLRWGTRLENVADTKRHGRQPRGEDHGGAKLSARQVIQIRRQRAAGKKLRELAAKYGVSTGAISLAARGITWS